MNQCGFRMLEPQEIKLAMGFPPDYQILGTRRQQVHQLGNAVTPAAMQLLVERCMASVA